MHEFCVRTHNQQPRDLSSCVVMVDAFWVMIQLKYLVSCTLWIITNTHITLIWFASMFIHRPNFENLKSTYPEEFTGFGKLPVYRVHVLVDPNITPVAQPAHSILVYLRAKVDEKLKQLMDMDIIEKVSGPTTWTSPLVVVPKPNGDIRVCVDM